MKGRGASIAAVIVVFAVCESAFSQTQLSPGSKNGWRINARDNTWPKLVATDSYGSASSSGNSFASGGAAEAKPPKTITVRRSVSVPLAPRAEPTRPLADESFYLFVVLIGWWGLASFWAMRTWSGGSM